MQLFRNGSVYEFYRLKALIILKQVNTSVVEKKKKKIRWRGYVNFHCMQMRLVMILWSIFAIIEMTRCWSSFDHVLPKHDTQDTPSYNFAFRSSVQKNGLPGEEKHGGFSTEKRLSQKWFHFSLHWPFLEYFVYLASTPRNSEVVANQEGFLHCSIEAFLDNLIIGVTL